MSNQLTSKLSVIVSKLSIIIPAYNEGKFIVSLLNRVLEVKLNYNIQKEIIVIDDCSQDNSKSIVEDYAVKHSDKNIRLITQPANMGKGAAIHKGIEAATGDFLII